MSSYTQPPELYIKHKCTGGSVPGWHSICFHPWRPDQMCNWAPWQLLLSTIYSWLFPSLLTHSTTNSSSCDTTMTSLFPVVTAKFHVVRLLHQFTNSAYVRMWLIMTPCSKTVCVNTHRPTWILPGWIFKKPQGIISVKW